MKVKANNKIYDAMGFTNDKDKIEEFAGKGSVVRTRIDGVGFTAKHEYAINGAQDSFWLSQDAIAIKNSRNEVFWMPVTTYNEIFGKKWNK